MNGEGKHILVCDDDVTTLQVVRQTLLTHLSAHVDSVTDPEYAFEMVLKKQYDLLIFDLVMPNIDGNLLYSLILKVYDHLLPKEHQIPPVILISGNAYEKRAQDFRRMPGVRALVAKPFTVERLITEVKAVFASK